MIKVAPLPKLPDCPSLKDGVCEHLQAKVTPLVCAYCQHRGPFCGKVVSPEQMMIFKNAAPLILNPRKSPPPDKSTLEARSGWRAAKDTWLKAETFLNAVKSRGYLATLAETIGISGKGYRVDEATYQTRHRSCFGDGEAKPCEMLIQTAKGSFCGACGCGERKLARLDDKAGDGYSKLHFPVLSCPLKRPGFSNATGE